MMLRGTVQALALGWITLGWGGGGRLDDAWREVRYKGRTAYATVADTVGVRLRAEAHDQNSALLYPLPRGAHARRLRWRWRVLRHPEGADPSRRALDDRAAAVVVLVRRGLLPWRTRGLLYQWAPAGRSGTWAPSPYAREIHVLTLRQTPAGDAWFDEERDLEADLRAAFGEVPRIQAIGVLCDADNTGDRAIAEFGELQIEREDAGAGSP